MSRRLGDSNTVVPVSHLSEDAAALVFEGNGQSSEHGRREGNGHAFMSRFVAVGRVHRSKASPLKGTSATITELISGSCAAQQLGDGCGTAIGLAILPEDGQR